MRIALYNADGQMANAILMEALKRKHYVTALTSLVPKNTGLHTGLNYLHCDIINENMLIAQLAGHDAVVASLNISSDMEEYAGRYGLEMNALFNAFTISRIKRFVAVGHPGCMDVAPGYIYYNQPDFKEKELSAALACSAFYSKLKKENTNEWVIAIPATETAPVSKGRYKTSNRAHIFSADGKNAISINDFAIAVIDEIEKPRYSRELFTAAYDD